jgi:general secretion pathway protein E
MATTRHLLSQTAACHDVRKGEGYVQGGIRSMFGLAAVMLALGFLSAVLTAPGVGVDQVSAHVIQLAERALGSGRWLMLTVATTGLLTVVLLLASVVWMLERANRAPKGDRSASTAKNLQEHLLDAKRRIESNLLTEKPDVITAFNELIRGALAVVASDIHMTPTPSHFKLTYRVHGTLREVCELPLEWAPRLTGRAKVLAQLDTYVHSTPQDGRLVVELGGDRVDARVSCLPTEFGERVVLRLVRGSRTVPELDTLGFSNEVLRKLKDVLSKPQGLLFVTAPVGSGKTTTMYAAMQYIVKSRGATTSIVTLEDPIEIELPFATQTQMNTRSGLTFAATLRSVLRQDPNVLMVGEIRDKETADIAIQAGLTGHLILTTVHGESAAAPFARLMELEIEPFILSSATVGCLSQRLVRTLCTRCRMLTPPDPVVVARFQSLGCELPKAPYYEPKGCAHCENLGFTGRAPVAELLVMDAEIRKVVNERRSTKEIVEVALSRGMVPLVRSGLTRAVRGETSLSEVLRVAG